MLPYLRISGNGGSQVDSMGDFLGGVSAAMAAAAASNSHRDLGLISRDSNTNNPTNGNNHNNNNSRLIQAPSSSSSSAAAWGALNKTLADFVKDSSWPTSASSASTNANQLNNSNTTSMPWAAAVKSPPDHSNTNNSVLANNIANVVQSSATNSSSIHDYNHTTIGSWSSLETSSSNRHGWNNDSPSKNEGAFDDGTAIWGNPSNKKSGIDWTDKEAALNNVSQKNVNSEKRIQKPEPTISSINGTEAWGAALIGSNGNNSNNSLKSQTNNQQQKPIHNDISGNTYGTKLMAGDMIKNDKLTSWPDQSSSLQAANVVATNGNSSPPNNSVWNNLGLSNKQPPSQQQQQQQQQKSSDWLSLSSPNASIYNAQNNTAAAVARFDELRNHLESTSIFDSVPSMSKSASNKNSFLDQRSPQLGVGIGLGSMGGVVGGSGGDSINDLKQQMSANFSNDLVDSPTRQHISAAINNNQQQQQQQQSQSMDSGAYSTAAPSRDLLKQMVHQIQLAVQAGHLSAHILNQPMSTPTLQLVYQLLQQIKTLHQLQDIQQRSSIKMDMGSPSNLDLQLNRIKQNISLLQKAISQQQAASSKNETMSEQQGSKQQPGDDSSFASISKLSTNMKVPANNISNIINNSNIDSFRRSSLIDSLKNSSDPLHSAQATFDATNAAIDKSVSSYIQAAVAAASVSADNPLVSCGTNKAAQQSDFSKIQGFTTNNSNNINQQQSKCLLQTQSSSSAATSSAWSAFSSGDYDSQQGWPSQSRISSNVSQDEMISALYDWSDLASTTAALQLNPDNDHSSKQQQQLGVAGDPIGTPYSSSGVAGTTAAPSGTATAVAGRPAPPPGLYYNFFF